MFYNQTEDNNEESKIVSSLNKLYQYYIKIIEPIGTIGNITCVIIFI